MNFFFPNELHLKGHLLSNFQTYGERGFRAGRSFFKIFFIFRLHPLNEQNKIVFSHMILEKNEIHFHNIWSNERDYESFVFCQKYEEEIIEIPKFFLELSPSPHRALTNFGVQFQCDIIRRIIIIFLTASELYS